MGGNPKGSEWRVTGNDRRNRERLEITVEPETLDGLEELAGREGVSKSVMVDRLVAAELATGRRRARTK